MQHMTRDMWHVTPDMLWGVNILSKFQLSSPYGFWFILYFEDLEEKADWLTDWINQLLTKVFVEQPQLHQVCQKYFLFKNYHEK